MHTVTSRPFTGTYAVEPIASTFAFAVRHSGVFWFRGVFTDVAGTLTADGDHVTLEGTARAESISVREPQALHDHLLAADFFAVADHPQITFRSTAVSLADDGRAQVDGDLTIRGVTRPVSAAGTWASPREVAFGEVAGLGLHTCFDRRDFGFAWQMELPGGGEAVGWDVEVDIDLLLRRVDGPGGGAA